MRLLSLLFLACVVAPGLYAAPVIDPPIPDASQPARVAPQIPVGKTLLFPITASSSLGGRLAYTVSSSNPAILVRAKTGNPALRLMVDHAAGTNDPAYSGVMEFMLFRDWLPITSSFVAGFAQAGYYDGLIFHRIANLGTSAAPEYIFQSGDPLGTGNGGPGMTNNDASTSWKFENEFVPGIIFSGRGQLAMANAGTSTGYYIGNDGALHFPDYLDSNGSQFFITESPLRELDFRHSTFGQMLRGWQFLPLLRQTQVTSEKPNSDVKLVSATVVENETDAVLVFSAKALGTATITVTVTDAAGSKATQSFVVTAVKDTFNDQPFIARVDPLATPKDVPIQFSLRAVDLELDYTYLHQSALVNSSGSTTGASLINDTGSVVQMVPNPGYTGLVNLGFDIRQFDIKAGGFDNTSDSTNAYVAVGDRAGRPEGVNLDLQAGVPISNLTLALLHDTDPGGVPGDFTTRINWGDGSPLVAGTVLAASAEPGANVYAAQGTHTYPKPGIYPVVVEFFGNLGARATVRSTAYVAASNLSAAGESFSLASALVSNRLLATFTDLQPGVPGDYTAVIDWGDGRTSAGVVQPDVTATGAFLVRGTHAYLDSEPYAVRVRIHKKSLAATADVFAWSRLLPSFTPAVPHLPPFAHPKLTLAWNSGPTKSVTGLPGPDYQTTYHGTLVIINTGNQRIGTSQLRFWLSDDTKVDTTGPHPDLLLPANGLPSLSIISFAAGQGGTGTFDFKPPKGQSTGRKYLLAEAIYSNPIADNDGTAKVLVAGPLPGSIIVRPETPPAASIGTILQTTENGGQATFTVVLDTAPINTAAAGQAANDTVTIALTSSNPAEGTVSPAQLVFNSSNWYTPQRVTVTGVSDGVKDGNKNYTITLGAAQSADPIYKDVTGPSVSVVNLDLN